MDLEEELYEDSTEEQPVVLDDPKTQVYLPVATTQTKGIASFDAKDFNVDPSGKVALNEDLHQIKENTDSALENSQEAKETADSAKEAAEEALSTGNTALNIANSIDEKATEALSTANEALEQVVESLGTGIYVNGVLQKSVNVKSDIQEQFDQLTEEVEDIKELVPGQASSQNQLADKNFVNSSINAIAAFYITYDNQGNPFPTKAALSSATTFYSAGEVRVPTRNDYCLVLADETHDNASCRYVYSGEYPNGQWDFQFIVNESPFTSDQVAAINSGITSNLVQQIPNKADLTNDTQEIRAGTLIAKKLQIKTGAIEFDDSANTFWTGSNLNIGGNLEFVGLTTIAKLTLLNVIYPIGSIYMSVNNVSPESFLGGKWEQLPANYALWTASSGAGDTIAPGLPNITGSFDTLGAWYNSGLAMSGAFTRGDSSSSAGMESGSGNDLRKIVFSANDGVTPAAKNIYRDSVTTVQPPAYKVYVWKRTT